MRSILKALAWQARLAATGLEQLGCCQNRELRVKTGQLQATAVATLGREAGESSIMTLMRR